MYFNIKCIGKLPGPTNKFERSLVFETGEFERPKLDCIMFYWLPYMVTLIWPQTIVTPDMSIEPGLFCLVCAQELVTNP